MVRANFDALNRDDCVSVTLTLHGRGARSGVDVATSFGWAAAVRDELIFRVVVRDTVAQAREALRDELRRPR